MSYKKKFEAYLDGSLDEEKAMEIEEDLEKVRVINEYLEEELDDKLFEAEDKEVGKAEENIKDNELKNLVQKAINKKLRIYGVAIGSIVLSVVLFLMFGLSPIMDRMYYNPSEKLGEYDSVIDLPLAVYTELHCANRWFDYTNITSEGYGKYSLKVGYQFNGEIEDFYVNLDKGKFVGYYSDILKNNLYSNSFTRGTSYNYFEPDDEYILEELRKLPDTAVVEASVSFPNDLTLEELNELQESKQKMNITYVPIRVANNTKQIQGYFGFEPFGTGIVFSEETYDNEKYPLLELANREERYATIEQWETHIKSMIKYMADAKEFNEAINNGFDYEAALEYIESQGIKTFGAVVRMQVKDLLELRDTGVVENISVMDVKLSNLSR